MPVIETMYHENTIDKETCDLCGEIPENLVLFEKPKRVIANKQMYFHVRSNPLFVCLDCLQTEAENL